MTSLSSSEIRDLKAKAQRLEPVLKVGKEGLSERFLKSADAALSIHKLIKVKFAAFKEEKRELAPILAEKTSSHLVTLIGNVAVLYRSV
jgi:RNA-binding protein